MTEYKTRNVHEAAYLWANEEFVFKFDRLESLDKFGNKFKFVMTHECSEEERNQLVSDWDNSEAHGNIKEFMNKWNILKDKLRRQKGDNF